MGKLIYDAGFSVDFDDRLLAHLQIVMTTKLRRGESFLFTWRDDPDVGDGRTSLWLNPSIPLVFKYFGGRQPVINRGWIEALAETAHSPTGLRIVAEPVTNGHKAGE